MFRYLLTVFLLLPASDACSTEGNASFSHTSLSFGPWRTGETATDTVRVVNTGASSFTLSAIALAPAGPFLSPTPITPATTLEAGETAVLPISFTPTALGNQTTSLEIEVGGVPSSIPISGEGVEETIVINEILADPPTGGAGDSNNDGSRHSAQDEFVELLNISHYTIALAGHTLSDRGTSLTARFTFPPGTVLDPGERLVLFGGGTPTGFEAKVFVDDGKIGGGLTNSGDAVYLITSAGDTLSKGEYGKEGGADQAIVRHPDGRGPFVKHKTAPSLERFSPGRIRSPAASIQVVVADTVIVVMGERVTPKVIAIANHDTVDATMEVVWSSSDPSIVSGDTSGLTAIRPGVVQSVARFDTLQTQPLWIVSRLPAPFTLSATSEDTVVLKETEFVVSVQAESGKTRIPVENLYSWEASGTVLAERTSPTSFIAHETGSGSILFGLEDETTTVHFTSAEPGDFDLDGTLTTADILRLIHIALEIPPSPEDYEWIGADSNQDNVVDVVDLVALIDQLIGNPTNTKPQPMATISWEQVGTTLHVSGSSASFLVVELDEAGSAFSTGLHSEGAAKLWVLRPDAGGGIGLPILVNVTGRVMGVHGSTYPAGQVDRPIPRSLKSFPNPFNAQTIVSFAISTHSDLTLDIYSVLGQRVARLAEGLHNAGKYRISWNGQDDGNTRLGSGVYLAQLTTNTRTETVRMVLLQ